MFSKLIIVLYFYFLKHFIPLTSICRTIKNKNKRTWPPYKNEGDDIKKQKPRDNNNTLRAPSETDWIVLGCSWQTLIWRETRPGKAAQMVLAEPGVSWSICCWSGPVARAVASDREGNNGGEEPDSPKCLFEIFEK